MTSILSGSTTQVVYFVAVDPTDKVTREPGLSNFTVYRSRNGGAQAAMTTPTVTEVGANMPGVYGLLVDEDTTLDAGFDFQQMALHITHGSMEPVTLVVDLARAKYAAGSTMPTITGDAYARLGAPAGASVSADVAAIAAKTSALPSDPADQSLIIDATNAVMSRLGAPAGASIAADIAGISGGGGGGGLDEAGVRAAVGMAAANLDTQLAAIMARLGVPTGSSLSADLSSLLTRLTSTRAGYLDNLGAALTESYRAEGATGTLAQLLYELIAHMGESSISGTTKTTRRVDGSTAAMTFTLDSATTPTSITRAT